ncbi:MAG: AMP-binding protein [Acidisphaera sp.]|nr:AMP-binding protein [Acidisphaera sp.]
MSLRAMQPSAEAVRRYTEAGYWGDASIGDILERAARAHPEREALVDGSRRLSYAQYWRQAQRLAAHWLRLGLTRDDVIAIQLPNWSEFAIAVAAASLLGIPFCHFHSDFRRKEVEFILGFSGASLLVMPSTFRGFDHQAMLRELRPVLPRLRHLEVVGEDVTPDAFDLRRFLDEDAPAEASEDEVRRHRPHGNDVLRLLFTSGTTGDPKAVVHTHNTSLASCRFHVHDYHITSSSAFLLFLPVGLNWGFGSTIQTLIAGCRIVYLDVFRPEAALALIERERITHFATAPAGLVAMLGVADFARYDLSSLEVVITGGASCPIELIRRWRAAAPGHLLELYGMAECGGQACTDLADDPEAVAGTVGRPSREMGMRLVDESDRDVPAGEVGEILSRGPSVMLGYYNNPDANARTFTRDGWARTGDLGTLDAAGYLRIVGRRKEMIIRGGANIYPREIEEVLHKHPAIADAAVIGLPDEKLGETACACIVLRPGASLSAGEVVDFLRGTIATYKLPERVHFLAALPRTPTGKVQRGPLRALVTG